MSEVIKRVLVILDNRSQGLEIDTALEQYGLSVDLVNKGIDALKFMQPSCPYDLLITALLLDEISGFALVLAAKKFHDVATIGLNNGDALLKSLADEFGIDKVLEFPLNLKELCDVSLEILEMTYNNQFRGTSDFE